jgi:MoxR-like ATPase
MSTAEKTDLNELLKKLREFSDQLCSCFVGREQEIEQMMVAAIAQEPLLFIGPPGTGKSEMITQFKNLLELPGNEYFEYMLTKFTEPSELLGPLDLKRLKAGEYIRRIAGKLPEAKLVFLDEIFKSNSAILNTLLTLLNEKKFYQDGKPYPVPLKILFAATNELPNLSELDALKDRFTLKVRIDKVSEDKWDELIMKGLQNEGCRYFKQSRFRAGLFSLSDFEDLHDHLQRSLREFTQTGKDPFFSNAMYLEFKRIVRTIRNDYEIPVTDRKLIKLYRLIRARALFMRGGGVERDDFSLLIHIGNQSDEIDFLREKLEQIIG